MLMFFGTGMAPYFGAIPVHFVFAIDLVLDRHRGGRVRCIDRKG